MIENIEKSMAYGGAFVGKFRMKGNEILMVRFDCVSIEYSRDLFTIEIKKNGETVVVFYPDSERFSEYMKPILLSKVPVIDEHSHERIVKESRVNDFLKLAC